MGLSADSKCEFTEGLIAEPKQNNPLPKHGPFTEHCSEMEREIERKKERENTVLTREPVQSTRQSELESGVRKSTWRVLNICL